MKDSENFSIPPALERVAAGRDSIGTEEFAESIGLEYQTVRRYLSERGDVFGVRPVKIGGRLHWPVSKIAVLLTEGTV
ncbi:hypothetical protein [Duganella callida]|uniref:DNA-binding protein n=1 Tax=Duganella callida TaxID=2561932 RepID=A0A4Y9RVW7_9BURK|nr:hypothetical protein [Duganella callida]TFW13290.1 hypothetical protein E4L98_29250 [Duganella callida]